MSSSESSETSAELAEAGVRGEDANSSGRADPEVGQRAVWDGGQWVSLPDAEGVSAQRSLGVTRPSPSRGEAPRRAAIIGWVVSAVLAAAAVSFGILWNQSQALVAQGEACRATVDGLVKGIEAMKQPAEDWAIAARHAAAAGTAAFAGDYVTASSEADLGVLKTQDAAASATVARRVVDDASASVAQCDATLGFPDMTSWLR